MARVLVIEDNPPSLKLMAYLLEAAGHQVLKATKGREGLEAVRAERPELILCDVQLPGMDGYEVAGRLKADRELRAIPLVAVTALAMVGDKEKVMGAGFDGYIPKPIEPEHFAEQVKGFLGRAPGQEAPAPVPAPAPAPAWSRAAVLVVDNSPANLALIRAILEPAGYQLREARGVEEALELLRRQVPDLILSDLHMPGQDGRQFIALVKADPRWREIPFVFCSATTWGAKDQQEGLSLGAVKFLLRPIEPEILLQEVEACLKGR